MTTWRLALRLAARDVRRSKGRSALVVAMAAIPAFALAGLATFVRSDSPAPAVTAEREFGLADAKVFGDGDLPAAVRKVLPDARIVAGRRIEGPVELPGDRVVFASGIALPLGDPMLAGSYEVRRGRIAERPGEAFVTGSLARRLRPGDVVRFPGGEPLTVVGLGYSFDQGVYVVPAQRLPGSANSIAYLDVPGSRDLTRAFADTDIAVSTRLDVLHPSPQPVDPNAVGAGVLAAGLAVLEAGLLAGSAFAVGIKRRQRELGLLGATGASPRQLRRIVVAHGALLGVVAGVAGVALGVAAAAGAREVVERTTDAPWPGPLRVVPLDLAGALLLGLVTGWFAALAPAVSAARRPVMEALTGRRGTRRPRRRATVAGLAAIAGGALVAAYGASSGSLTGSDRAPVILAGAALVDLGAVACSGALVGLVGRLARVLPLPLRLAARDAARSRARSGPAVAAIMAAVSGTVAVTVYVASDVERQREAYRPRLPASAAFVTADGLPEADARAVAERVAAPLPARALLPLRTVSRQVGPDELAVFVTAKPRPGVMLLGQIGIADPALFREIGVSGPATAVLDRAGLLAVDPSVVGRDGKAELYRPAAGAGPKAPPAPGERIEAALVALDFEPDVPLPSAFVSAETARRLGVPSQVSGYYVATTRPPTFDEVGRARAVALRASAYVDVERGFSADVGPALLALAAAGALVTVTATAVAVSLAASEARPDLATLAAVGAAPRLRRMLVSAQTLVVAGLGSALGLLAGLVPAGAVVGARPDLDLVVPWGPLAITLLGIPLAATAFTAAVTRSRLPLDRRLA